MRYPAAVAAAAAALPVVALVVVGGSGGGGSGGTGRIVAVCRTVVSYCSGWCGMHGYVLYDTRAHLDKFELTVQYSVVRSRAGRIT